MILIVLAGTSGAGKSTVSDALEMRLDPEHFACIGADESGLNWHDYAGTDRAGDYNADCLEIAAARTEGRHLVFASCLNPQDYFAGRAAPEGIEATYFVALAAADAEIERRLRARPPERGFTSDEAIRPHIEYNRWFRRNRGKFQLFLDTSAMTVEETADRIAERIRAWTD